MVSGSGDFKNSPDYFLAAQPRQFVAKGNIIVLFFLVLSFYFIGMISLPLVEHLNAFAIEVTKKVTATQDVYLVKLDLNKNVGIKNDIKKLAKLTLPNNQTYDCNIIAISNPPDVQTITSHTIITVELRPLKPENIQFLKGNFLGLDIQFGKTNFFTILFNSLLKKGCISLSDFVG